MEKITQALHMLQQLQETGKFIGSITTETMDDYVNDTYPLVAESRALGNCFESSDKISRYYFDEINYYDYIYEILDPIGTEKNINDYQHFVCRYLDLNDIKKDERLHKLLETHRQKAEYGDVKKQKTVIDINIRSGYDITIDQKVIRVSETLIRKLESIFSKNTGIFNISVEPYKINIYEENDFFKEHRDSPSKNLIGTMIINIRGDSDCFEINGIKWDKLSGNVLMFYSDVLHSVTPVKGYRETMTFKVYCKTQYIYNMINNTSCGDTVSGVSGVSGVSNESLNLSKKISFDKPIGILLQNGYNYMNMNKNNIIYKGIDRCLVISLTELGINFEIQPVIVKNEKIITKYSNEYYEEDLVRKYFIDVEESTCEGYKEEIANITVFNISDKLKKMINTDVNEISELPIYYLGNGYCIGEIKHNNMFIGNQYSGEAIENIYLNMLLIATPKITQ